MYQKALEFLKQEVPSQRTENYKRDVLIHLASTLFDIGRMMEDEKNVQQSLTFYQQALRVFAEVTQAFPQNPDDGTGVSCHCVLNLQR